MLADPIPAYSYNLKRFGQKILVWMVALVAMLQTVGEAIAAFLNDRGDLLVLWLVLTFAVAVTAATVENLKAYLEAS